MIADAQRVGDGGERGVHGADADEEAGVDDIEIVEFMRLAVAVEDGRAWVGAEATGAGLMGAARQGDVVVHIEVARHQMLRLQADLAEHAAQLVVKLAHRNLVVGSVGERDAAVAIDGDPIVGLGQILGRQPEIDGVAGDFVQGAIGRQRGQQRLLGPVHSAQRLADHLDIAHRVGEVRHAKIEVVQRQGLLEHRVVGRQRQRQHRLAVVKHVVAADLVRAVGQPVGMAVVGRAQQQRRGIGGAAGNDDDIGGEGLRRPVDFRDHPVDARPGRIGLELQRPGVAQQGHVRPLQRRAHGDDLGV